MKMHKTLLSSLCITFAFLMGGCGDITGRGPAPLDRTVGVPTLTHTRVGHVYCMRGWLGIFSTGMDALAVKIDTQVGAPAVSVADEEWVRLQEWLIEQHKKGEINEPLVLLGHSYGADDSIRVARTLKEAGISVDLLVLLDPVTPPLVPDNVKRVYCVYKSHPATDWYPAWRGVPAAVENPLTPIENINLRDAKVDFDTAVVGHENIEKTEGVHKMVMEQIEKVCPPRSVWVKTHGNSSTSPLSSQPEFRSSLGTAQTPAIKTPTP